MTNVDFGIDSNLVNESSEEIQEYINTNFSNISVSTLKRYNIEFTYQGDVYIVSFEDSPWHSEILSIQQNGEDVDWDNPDLELLIGELVDSQ